MLQSYQFILILYLLLDCHKVKESSLVFGLTLFIVQNNISLCTNTCTKKINGQLLKLQIELLMLGYFRFWLHYKLSLQVTIHKMK